MSVYIAELIGGNPDAANHAGAQAAFSKAVEAGLVIHAVNERLRGMELPSLKAAPAEQPEGTLNVASVHNTSAGRTA